MCSVLLLAIDPKKARVALQGHMHLQTAAL
jgi:hypothetical protein